jgi:DNA (cytosine-5)-methyltransferase 1
MGLIIDLFAGGGGASLGIFWATGRHPDIAINHDPLALAMHAANHPDTKHVVENVWHVRPRAIIGKRKVDILWASPDCTHFSKAKGSAPRRDVNRAKRSRGLAWVILRWARDAAPTTIFMENVEEWIDWCPLRKDGTPDPKRKGETRKRFIRELKKLGYAVEIVEKDRACDHGAPTIRQRLFMIARNDGVPVRRPMPTHASKDAVQGLFAGAVKPWRTAAEIIDWSLRCPSIFTRKKELAPATKRRIARGMKRYVIDAADPFIVPITHQGDNRVHSIHEPMRTVTTANRGELALATAVHCARRPVERRAQERNPANDRADPHGDVFWRRRAGDAVPGRLLAARNTRASRGR